MRYMQNTKRKHGAIFLYADWLSNTGFPLYYRNSNLTAATAISHSLLKRKLQLIGGDWKGIESKVEVGEDVS